MSRIDPVCLVHGLKLSEHYCLYCYLCFESLTVDDCSIDEEGNPTDVCKRCVKEEGVVSARKHRRT